MFTVLALLIACAGLSISIVQATHENRRETTGEVPITDELSSDLSFAGFPITLQRGFEVSSYGVKSGVGISLTAFQFPPTEAAGLIEALKAKNPEYEWSNPTSDRWIPKFLGHLIPPELLPRKGTSDLLWCKPVQGPAISELVIAPSDGLLYFIDTRL